MKKRVAAVLVFLVASVSLLAVVITQKEQENKAQEVIEIPAAGHTLTVYTHNKVYPSEEGVEFTVVNNTDISLYVSRWIDGVERKTSSGSWERLKVECGYPYCLVDKDGPQELKPSESFKSVWHAFIYPGGKTDRVPAPLGIYRLIVNYENRNAADSEEWKWHSAVSNEFLIQ